MKTTSLDIIVPTRNRGDLILETLESLLASPHTDFAVWVIDQSADDGTKNIIVPMLDDKRLHYVRSAKEGSNLARNLGISMGNAPLVAFTDDDCIVDPRWIDELIEAFNDDSVSAIFGRVIDQSIGLAGEDVTAGIKIAVKDEPQREVFQGNRFQLGFGHGANMAFRRSVLDLIAGFDPLLGNGAPLCSWPEKDIGYRILALGGAIVYEPRIIVHHKQWRTWSGVKKTQRNYGFGAGAVGGRYLKNGDFGGMYLMFHWMADQGVRQVASGIFKWRSWQKITAGLIQIIYPIPGFFTALLYPARRNPKSAELSPTTLHKPTNINPFTHRLN